jgi:flavorubredoxin
MNKEEMLKMIIKGLRELQVRYNYHEKTDEELLLIQREVNDFTLFLLSIDTNKR